MTPAVNVGDMLPPIKLVFTRDALVRYAGASGDFNPIHYSDALADEVGLDSVIAHGMLTMGAAIRVVTDWVGDAAAVTSYAVRFSRPVPVPALGETRLDVNGRVTAIADEGASVTVAITVSHDGSKVLGKAIATVRLPTTSAR